MLLKQSLSRLASYPREENFIVEKYKTMARQFDSQLCEHLRSSARPDHKLIYFILKKLYALRLGSTSTVSLALEMLQAPPPLTIQRQQGLLALAAQHNLCDAITFPFDPALLTARSINYDILLYFSLKRDPRLLNFCRALPTKPLQVYYYLQDTGGEEYSRSDLTPGSSLAQSRYRSHLQEPFEEERKFGLYLVDFYLPQSQKVVEVNGHSHYLNFGERRTGKYQSKYNFLKSKMLQVEEVMDI